MDEWGFFENCRYLIHDCGMIFRDVCCGIVCEHPDALVLHGFGKPPLQFLVVVQFIVCGWSRTLTVVVENNYINPMLFSFQQLHLCDASITLSGRWPHRAPTSRIQRLQSGIRSKEKVFGLVAVRSPIIHRIHLNTSLAQCVDYAGAMLFQIDEGERYEWFVAHNLLLILRRDAYYGRFFHAIGSSPMAAQKLYCTKTTLTVNWME